MKVICRSNQNSSIDPNCGLYTPDPTVTLDIEVGREYLVYALGFEQYGVVYYLCGSNYTFYPHWYPASLFEITDSRPSQYWQRSQSENKNERITAFPEWAANPNGFYWNLTEHDKHAVEAWKKYKAMIEAE